MSQPSGMKMLDCPYCKQRYRLTNFMMRQKNNERDNNGKRLWNTHLLKCFRIHKDSTSSQPESIASSIA